MTDSVSVTTVVDAEPKLAFEIFTTEVDSWWKRGPRFRAGLQRPGTLRFEPGPSGRLIELDDAAGHCFIVGNILAWEPGARLVFEWRAHDFDPDQVTEVEVLFEAEGEGCRVTVEHRGWSFIPDDHPARRGLRDPAFFSMVGQMWADLLTAHRAHTQSRALK